MIQACKVLTSTETLDVLKPGYEYVQIHCVDFNRNIGCIETHAPLRLDICSLHFNRNIGCIETEIHFYTSNVCSAFNRNIGCIETILE